MIDNPNQLDKMVVSLTDEETDTVIYIRSDHDDGQVKGLICGNDEDITDMLFSSCLNNPDLRNILHNVLILVEEHEAKNN